MARLEVPDLLWMDGEVRRWSEGTVHVWTDAVQRATSVFEGIRGYWNPETSRHHVVHWNAHLKRLHRSSAIMSIPIAFTDQDIWTALSELLAALDYREDIYIRPTAYLNHGGYSTEPDPKDAGFFIPVFPVARDRSITRGITCVVSTWRRADDTVIPARAKTAANYAATRLARIEAIERGADEAILLTQDGRVSETGGASVFVVREGVVATPPTSDSILESITRRSVIELLREMGRDVEVRSIDRSELYVADEVFLTGTLAEITSVSRIDHHAVDSPADTASKLRDRYIAACVGSEHRDPAWFRLGPSLGSAI